MADGKKPDFKCRICGCSECKEKEMQVRVTGGLLGWVTLSYCAGCSVVFLDEDAFTAAKPAEPPPSR